MIGIYTNEAIEECKNHLESISYFVAPDGNFYNTLDTQNCKLAIHALTYANEEELSKIIPE